MSTAPPQPSDAQPASDTAAGPPDAATLLREGARHVARLVRLRPLSFGVAVAGAVVFVSAIIASSLVVGWITDEVVAPVLDDGAAVGERLPAALGAVLGVALWKAAGITVRRAAASRAQFGALADLRKHLVAHQLARSVRWFAGQRVGDLLAVNESHARQSTFVLGPLPFGTGAVLLLFGATAVVTWIDPVLGVLVGIALLAITVVDVLAAWSTFHAFEREMALRTEVTRVAHESIDGAQTIRALGRADEEVARFAEVVDRRRRAEIVVGRRWSWFRSIIETLPPALAIPIVVVGALRVGDGLLSPGDVVTVAYLMSLLSMPLALIGFLLWDTAHALSAWRLVDRVLQADDHLPSGDARLGDDGPARLELRGVSFAHGAGLPRVLHAVDLHVPAGRTVAIVGPTGSGKSSLCNLVARLWDPDEGQVVVDGVDVRDLAPDVLPRTVARVDQEPFLFGDTVRENVTLGRPVDGALLARVAELAAVEDVVAALPDGWDTVVGERGATLSGGQRQRLALARALAGEPRLLVLDDATSAVDPSIEARILASLRHESAPATVLMVATRPAAVALADTVVLLVDGRVVAVGPHEQLLADVPAYADLLQAYERDAAARGVRADGPPTDTRSPGPAHEEVPA